MDIMDMVLETSPVVKTVRDMETIQMVKVLETDHGQLTTHGGELMEAIIHTIIGGMDNNHGIVVVSAGVAMAIRQDQQHHLQLMEPTSQLEMLLLTSLMIQ